MLVKSLLLMLCLILLVSARPARAVSMADFPQQLLAETNLARTAPKEYAKYLRALRTSYEGKVQRIPGSTAMVMTSEGVAAVDEAIAFLEKQSPLPALKWSDGLAEAAGDLVREQVETGGVGHRGRSSGDMQARIERHGTWSRRIAENIGYGPESPRHMVMELIIDDGVRGRGHRKNIFTRSFTVAGAACGTHPKFRTMCVMDFAGGYKSRGGKR